jgi:hypothetical protein
MPSAWATFPAGHQARDDAGGNAMLATVTAIPPKRAGAWRARSGDGTASTAASVIVHGDRASSADT